MPRPRKPTEILKLSGSRWAKGRTSEPHVEPRLPEPPKWLDPASAEHWPRLGGILLELGLIGDAYGDALAMLCRALADFIKVSSEAAKAPYTVQGHRGAVAHPIHRVYDAAWHRLLKMLTQFGMTPSSMSSVQTTTRTNTGDEYSLKSS